MLLLIWDVRQRIYIYENTPYINKSSCPPLHVSLPDGTFMQASSQVELRIQGIPEEAKKAFTFPTMHNKALLSLGTFCDNGYKVVLTKNKIFINYKNNKYKSLQGDRWYHWDVYGTGPGSDTTNKRYLVRYFIISWTTTTIFPFPSSSPFIFVPGSTTNTTTLSRPSKQRLRTNKTPRHRLLSPQSMLLSVQNNLGKNDKCELLHYVAGPHCRSRHQVSPRRTCNN